MANKGKYVIGIRLLLEKQYLEANAGRNRYVSRKQLEDYLKEQGYPVEKKTLYTDFIILENEFGLQLEYDVHKKGYRLLNPPFEPYELRLMMDCVQASTFITESEAKSISVKIKRLANEHERSSLDRFVIVCDRVDRAENSVLRKVDIIHQALQLKTKISFRYFQYYAGRTERRKYYLTYEGNDRLIINPSKLILKNGKYYLDYYRVSNDFFTPNFCPLWFELECMDDIQILSDKCDTNETSKIIPSEIFDLLEGKERVVSIRFRNNFIQDAFDYFGHDSIIIPLDNNHFRIDVHARCGPELYRKISALGCYAKILGPQEAINGFNDFIRDLSRLYDSDKEPYYVLSQEELDEIYMDDE